MSSLLVDDVTCYLVVFPMVRDVAFGDFGQLCFTDEDVAIGVKNRQGNHAEHYIKVQIILELFPRELVRLHFHRVPMTAETSWNW